MALQTPSPARVRTSRGGMTLRFPKEVVTQSLWKKIADMGWMQYVENQPEARPAAPQRRTYREIAESLPPSKMIDDMVGIIPPFTDEEIAADPRLEAILKR